MRESANRPFEALHGGDGVGKRRILVNERSLLVGGDGVLELDQDNVLYGARHGDRKQKRMRKSRLCGRRRSPRPRPVLVANASENFAVELKVPRLLGSQPVA